MKPAVFLDRDDTLIANREITAGTEFPGDLFDPDLVRLLPGAAAGCSMLRQAGFALVVVSNQGAVARGRCTITQVEACNDRMRQLLRDEGGVDVDAVYYCPYHPRGTTAPFNIEHPWRKPSPGMFLQASWDLGTDMTKSWAIGDAERDIAAALAAGIDRERTILVGDDAAAGSTDAGTRVHGVRDGAMWILGHLRTERSGGR